MIGLAALPVGYFAYSSFGGAAPKAAEVKDAVPKPTEAPKAFTGGDQGFISLKLEEVIPYNHNTKRFRFALPSEEHVSGLDVACMKSSSIGLLNHF